MSTNRRPTRHRAPDPLQKIRAGMRRKEREVLRRALLKRLRAEARAALNLAALARRLGIDGQNPASTCRQLICRTFRPFNVGSDESILAPWAGRILRRVWRLCKGAPATCEAPND